MSGNQNDGIDLIFIFCRWALIICAAASFGELSCKNISNLQLDRNAYYQS